MNDTTRLDRLQSPGSTETSVDRDVRTPDQLKLLAAQFESLLLSQMLSQMRSSMFDDDEGDSGFAKGPLADAMYTELSMALGRAGGFGLGDAMIAPLLRQAEAVGADTAGTMAMPERAVGMGQPGGGLSMGATSTAAALPDLVKGAVTSSFGWRRHPIDGALKFHKGLDIAMPAGRDVSAARSGEVTFAGRQGAYGLTVLVDHGGGMSTRYAHLSELLVRAGDAVQDGQTIGRSGATGRVTGAHLHFEVLQDGTPQDPAVALGGHHDR